MAQAWLCAQMSETCAASTLVALPVTSSNEADKGDGSDGGETEGAHRPTHNHVMFRMTRAMAALVVQRTYRGWKQRKLSLYVSKKLNIAVCRLAGLNP